MLPKKCILYIIHVEKHIRGIKCINIKVDAVNVLVTQTGSKVVCLEGCIVT